MAYIPSLPGGDKSPLAEDDKTVVHGAYGCGYSTAGEVAKSIMREKRHGSRMRIASGGWTQEADADWFDAIQPGRVAKSRTLGILRQRKKYDENYKKSCN